MNKKTEDKDILLSVKKVAQSLGINIKIIKYHIDAGKIEAIDGLVSESVRDKILEQKDTYIGIKSFLEKHDGGRFESKYARNRKDFNEFFETNDRFGIELIDPDEILFEIPERWEYYITKEDAQFLEYKSERFFEEFGFSEEEKVFHIINSSKNHPLSNQYIRRFITHIDDEKNIYTPAFTSFVRIIFDLPDIKHITDEDIVSVIENAEIIRTKSYLSDFFNFVARYEKVLFRKVKLKRKEKQSVPAYSYEDFVKLAKILFNVNYDKEHNLTLKAFEKSKYIEMWMFLSCHYICGWRSSDICDRWIYPDLKSNDNPFNINIESIKDDILNEKIVDDTYDKIALYVIRRIEMANNMPQKTGKRKLRTEMVPELRLFFGKLTLIAEYHHIKSKEGYMNSNRTAMYRNWVTCIEFFGEDIFAVTGRRSLSSRRLNKSYLQGMEETTKNIGYTTLEAHVVAAFARNHSNIDTTAIYLKDHALTGESAEVVLYMMMQRGVYSVSLYNILIAAYPDAFERLSAKEQTLIMEKIPLSAYELETVGPVLLASGRIAEVFSRGETEEPKEILRAMFAVAQGKGMAKEVGVFCMKKALGYSCVHPQYESCLANICPYHVFTSDGIPALIKVIKEYQTKEAKTGNKKYGIALKNIIVPAFQDIINSIIKDMTKKDKAGLEKLIEVFLNE